MPRAALGLSVATLLALVVWLSGRQPNPAPPRPEPPKWAKVHDGGKFVVYRANTTPAAYLIAAGAKGVLIDHPAALPKSPVEVESVLLTHHHRDGCDGVPGTATVFAPKLSQKWLEPTAVAKFWRDTIPLRSSDTGYFVHPTGIAGIKCTLTDGHVIDFHGVKVEVIATPGHSPDHVGFAVGDLIFLGDAMTGDGKLWTPFTTDWDHWQDGGLKAAAASLRKLAARKPAKLFPARGPVVSVNPMALLEATANKVDEAGFLKSFERFTKERLGNPPKYEYLVPEKQPKSNGSQPWAKVSPSLWITGNTYVLKSAHGDGIMVIDPWGTRSVEQIEKLRTAEKLGAVELVAFSHAHYDHFDGVYTLPVKGEYKIWALDLVARPLAEPFRYRAPFLDERPIRFARTFTDGETGKWHEYAFKFHHFPGQSYFTAATEVVIDGKRCLFTADNFFHQDMYSGSGGWMGMNRSTPAGYAASARKVLDLKPEWILAEHGGPFVFDAEDFRRRVAWGEAAAKACDALCVTGDHRNDWSPHSVSVSPILVKAKPGAEVKCEVSASKFPFATEVEVKTDFAGEKRFRVPANSPATQVVKLRVPADAKPGRVVIPVTARGPRGEIADPFLAVDVE